MKKRALLIILLILISFIALSTAQGDTKNNIKTKETAKTTKDKINERINEEIILSPLIQKILKSLFKLNENLTLSKGIILTLLFIFFLTSFYDAMILFSLFSKPTCLLTALTMTLIISMFGTINSLTKGLQKTSDKYLESVFLIPIIILILLIIKLFTSKYSKAIRKEELLNKAKEERIKRRENSKATKILLGALSKIGSIIKGKETTPPSIEKGKQKTPPTDTKSLNKTKDNNENNQKTETLMNESGELTTEY